MMPLKKSSLVDPAALPAQWLLSDIGTPMTGVTEVPTTGDCVHDQAVQAAFAAQALGSCEKSLNAFMVAGLTPPITDVKSLRCCSKSASAAASLPFGLPKYPPTTYLAAIGACRT